MTEAYAITMPPGGWTVDDLDSRPETHRPAIYARHGVPHYWRVELEPLRIRLHRLGAGDGYRETGGGEERLSADEPFGVDVPLPDLLPRWAR